MEIGDLLKTARKDFGYTQEEVSEKLGVTRQSISNWENGKTYPDIASIIKLSDIYNISLDTMLKGDEKIVRHLENNTNIEKSNRKLILLFSTMLLLAFVFILAQVFDIGYSIIFRILVTSILVIIGLVLFEIIERF